MAPFIQFPGTIQQKRSFDPADEAIVTEAKRVTEKAMAEIDIAIFRRMTQMPFPFKGFFYDFFRHIPSLAAQGGSAATPPGKNANGMIRELNLHHGFIDTISLMAEHKGKNYRFEDCDFFVGRSDKGVYVDVYSKAPSKKLARFYVHDDNKVFLEKEPNSLGKITAWRTRALQDLANE